LNEIYFLVECKSVLLDVIMQQTSMNEEEKNAHNKKEIQSERLDSLHQGGNLSWAEFRNFTRVH